MTDTQTRIIETPSLTELIEEFAAVLDAPAGLGVTDTDAKFVCRGCLKQTGSPCTIPVYPGGY